MNDQMTDHFSETASTYSDMRIFDQEPIDYIKKQHGGTGPLEALDIGCGTGRFDLMLFKALNELKLWCIDSNVSMLNELTDYLTKNGIFNFETAVIDARVIPFMPEQFDSIFSFNSVHYFNFRHFISEARRLVKPGGQIFIYTRTPDQNLNNIWGMYFPDFAKKETRLMPSGIMRKILDDRHGFEVIDIINFKYKRESSMEQLLMQCRSKHYSTFSLYAEKEFHEAVMEFQYNLYKYFEDIDKINWTAENCLLHIRRVECESDK